MKLLHMKSYVNVKRLILTNGDSAVLEVCFGLFQGLITDDCSTSSKKCGQIFGMDLDRRRRAYQAAAMRLELKSQRNIASGRRKPT
jgi:hypothetical protein